MSHEIRTPMNAVLGLTYLLEKTALQVPQQDLVRKIIAAGQSLLGIINDVLDVSKIEAGRLEVEHVPFRLSAVLENVVNINAPNIGDKPVELAVCFNNVGIEHLYGDALRLEQILTNLTSNAIKFTSSGEISIRAEVLSSKDDQVMLRFAVSDSGIGIPLERQQDIFQAFAQEDSSTTRRYGGTGLGLTICRHLVQLMGGEIGVISVPGQGSQFWFSLPFQVLTPPAVEPELALQVLVADDSASARAMLADTVKSLGWQADVVESGEDAVSKAMVRLQHNLPYDVFLLDWRMPGMDGLMAAKAIREASSSHRQPPIVIMVTAHAREDLQHAPHAELADAVISKPVTPSTLLAAITQARQRRGMVSSLPLAAAEASSDIAGVRVLVVDDSEINREVAKRILESEGVLVFTAADGSQAVAWLSEQQADLVLMDIQMPIMDGYRATHAIRQQLQLHDLPIIALTAGAFKAQQEAAMAAGMNGFLSKPYNIEQIIALVRQHVAPAAGARNAVSASINIAVGLEAWGSVALYQQFLQQFAEQYANMGRDILAHLHNGESPQGKMLVHKLRGSAGTLALTEVYLLAGELEVLLATTVAPADCEDKAQQLARALQMACQAIADYTRVKA